ncbi:MAG: hypothetical protein OWQ54_02275 [Sulfolobaceae archaeon]|nr:hypothetical protein [Sulfolobaceae archaeon]
MQLLNAILAVLYFIPTIISAITSYKLLRLAIKVGTDEIYYLTIAFLFLLGFNLVSTFFVLLPLSEITLYLYSLASLLQAFSYLLFIFNFLEVRKSLFQLIPIILSAFLLAGVEGFLLAYLTLRRNKITAAGFILASIANFIAFISILTFNPLLLVISEFFNAIGVTLLSGGVI